ncbi:hypothetical protein WN48_09018 [Eufriesea mexicana]|nr:hypothetical protein WN48_09018 [Eufriesea mexicana]
MTRRFVRLMFLEPVSAELRKLENSSASIRASAYYFTAAFGGPDFPVNQTLSNIYGRNSASPEAPDHVDETQKTRYAGGGAEEQLPPPPSPPQLKEAGQLDGVPRPNSVDRILHPDGSQHILTSHEALNKSRYEGPAGPCKPDRHFASLPHGVELNHPCGLTVDTMSVQLQAHAPVAYDQGAGPPHRVQRKQRPEGVPGTRCLTRSTVAGNECRKRIARMTYETRSRRVQGSYAIGCTPFYGRTLAAFRDLIGKRASQRFSL